MYRAAFVKMEIQGSRNQNFLVFIENFHKLGRIFSTWREVGSFNWRQINSFNYSPGGRNWFYSSKDEETEA